MAVSALTVAAAVPTGYYQSLENKSGAELLTALTALSQPETIVSYGGGTKGTWASFVNTDVRLINGREAWWDMYSNNIVYLPTYDAMNIEHCVPNSWWGGQKTNPYKDLFHLNPSDAIANGYKSNHPLGEVSKATYDNGVIRVGTPAGEAGGSGTVFEPADEYKGDFARAYMYVFVTYAQNSWDGNKYPYMFTLSGTTATLQPWAAQLLLKWSEEDPVDSKEQQRNEAIFLEQGNRNPFIDMPALADYVWGARKNQKFVTAEKTVDAIDRPVAPVFEEGRLTHVNTYTGRWWHPLLLNIAVEPDAELFVSTGGGAHQSHTGQLNIPAASGDNDIYTVSAYTERTVGGMTLRSAVATLTLHAANPANPDMADAVWEPVHDMTQITDGGNYVLLSANTLHVMGADGGISTKFMPSAGFVKFDDADYNITQLPMDAAVVTLHKAGSNQYALEIKDVKGQSKGYYTTTAKNSMSLKSGQGTAATVSIDGTGIFKADFGSTPGTLQFNKTQPRFLNYTTSQTGIYLYRFNGYANNTITAITAPEESVEPVIISGNSIIAPEGSMIFDINGRQVSGSGLSAGIYIIVRTGGSAEKVLMP